MIKQTRMLIYLTISLLAITACVRATESPSDTLPDPGPKVEAEPSPTNPSSLDAEIMPTIDICEPLESPQVVFPRQEPVEGPREVMEAELVGDLVVSEGCLRVESLYNGSSYLPIWPPEFTLALENEIPVVLDGEGNTVGRVGEELYMGGGEGSGNALPECVRGQLPAECGGPFWVVGEGVRPNMRYDSDLIQIELISTTQRTAILLQKQPILDEWVEEPSSITGILRLYNPQRCPRLQSESGATDYLPIWPLGYTLQFMDGSIEILDGSGQVVTHEGAEVVLPGGAIPHSWESEHYRQLYFEIPGDCFGPYWIVEGMDTANP